MDIAARIKDMSGKSTFAIYSTLCINNEILCSGGNDVAILVKNFITDLKDKIK
jgi:hypothetical protein